MGTLKKLSQRVDPTRRLIGDVATAFDGYVDHRALAANVAEVHTIPVGAKFVRITTTVNSYINIGAAATIPADVTDGSSSILLVNAVPRVFALGTATTIGVIASAVCLVCLEFYS